MISATPHPNGTSLLDGLIDSLATNIVAWVVGLLAFAALWFWLGWSVRDWRVDRTAEKARRAEEIAQRVRARRDARITARAERQGLALAGAGTYDEDGRSLAQRDAAATGYRPQHRDVDSDHTEAIELGLNTRELMERRMRLDGYRP